MHTHTHRTTTFLPSLPPNLLPLRSSTTTTSPHHNPHTITHTHNPHTTPHLAQAAGIWECQPGGFPVNDRANTETVFIIAGAATITDEDGAAHELAAGSWHTLPKGWTGRWDVTETVRKMYVLTA